MTQSELAEWYKLETEFFQDHVRHTRYVEKEKNRYRRGNSTPGVSASSISKSGEPQAAINTPEGDLTKHIGSPLEGSKSYDINIFIVSMSPVRVKLGDFGISKRIQPQDTTTFHTQASTQIYGAPEVLGSGSNSEISCHGNSPQGTKNLVTTGNCPFPKINQRVITSNRQCWNFIPKAHAPNTAWRLHYRGRCTGQCVVGGFKSDNEDRRDQDETAQNRDEKHSGKKRRSRRNPTTQDNSKHAPGDVALKANPGLQSGSEPTASKDAGEKTDPRYSTTMSLKPPTSSPPMPNPHHGNSPQLAPGTNGRIGHTLKNEASAPILDAPKKRIAHPQVHPAGRAGSNQSPRAVWEDQGIKSCKTLRLMPVGGGAVENTSNGSNTHQNSNTGPNPNRNPNTGSNLSQNNISSNSNENPATGSNPNRNPNVNPNAVPNHNPNSNTGPNPNQNPIVG
ncbi:hypothetical protein B9Z19DRAFT_1130111 [Tuber borchii]|uniref:Protein kinase domain-containing protein n=1 Tax=Tuber borchii TaxID=42251 RepID=A0A2T6ZL69_TUBBO|nr:hypothetical protein B9Z19DRAFT_1130111 [Tuber borchii]